MGIGTGTATIRDYRPITSVSVPSHDPAGRLATPRLTLSDEVIANIVAVPRLPSPGGDAALAGSAQPARRPAPGHGAGRGHVSSHG